MSLKQGRARAGWARGAALVLLLSLLGCTGSVRRGSALYGDGRYIEAAEVFERTEERLPTATPREQAEYSLYRGLTLLVLGDTAGAQHWLQQASQLERAHPGALRHDKRALLERGFHDLSLRGASPVNPREAQGAKGATGQALVPTSAPAAAAQ